MTTVSLTEKRLTYQQQAPILENWVNTQVEKQQAIVLLGDFNHRLVEEGNRYCLN